MNEQVYEIRSIETEVRAFESEDGTKRIVGISPVFNQRSELLWDFREVIEPQALDNVLEGADVRARYNHSLILGRTKNGTLTLEKNATGLRYEILINENDLEALAAYEKIKRGDVDGSSFAFTVPDGGDTWKQENGELIRFVHEIDRLLDVGPVDFPAYPQSTAAVRSKIQEFQQLETEQAASGGAEVRKAAARRRSLQIAAQKYPETKE